ncbi:unnamed protein product, partial [Urochloa humidicola]
TERGEIERTRCIARFQVPRRKVRWSWGPAGRQIRAGDRGRQAEMVDLVPGGELTEGPQSIRRQADFNRAADQRDDVRRCAGQSAVPRSARN